MGPIDGSETSVQNYYCMMRKIPDERGSGKYTLRER